MPRTITIVVLLCMTPIISMARATSATDQQYIEQRQRALLDEAARQRGEVSRQQSLPAAPIIPEDSTVAPCFTVSHIRFEVSSQFNLREQAHLSRSYLNTCMGLPHINALIRDVSQLYLSHGFVTSRTFLPEQDLAGGTLTIAVLEGRIEAIVVNGQPDLITRTLFPGLIGRELNLRDLEQGGERCASAG